MNSYPQIVVDIIRDARDSGNERISLVDIIWQYDARNRLAILLEEINEALKHIDWVTYDIEGNEVFLCFTRTGQPEFFIDKDEFEWADKEYRRRFRAKLKEIKRNEAEQGSGGNAG